jgi:hypothetical protein
MTRDPLVRLLLRLAIAFVALQVAAVVLAFGLFLFVFLGGEPPMFHDAFKDLDFTSTTSAELP